MLRASSTIRGRVLRNSSVCQSSSMRARMPSTISSRCRTGSAALSSMPMSLARAVMWLRIERREDCPVCGTHPTITEYIDYVEFCSR